MLLQVFIASQGCAPRRITLPATAQSAADVTDVLVGVQASARDSVSFARFQPDLPAPDGPFVCSGRERLSPNLRTISATYPSIAESRATVVVMLDSTGKLVRYAERRGAPVRPHLEPGMTPEQMSAAVAAAADSARATVITLDYSRARAMIANRGGGREAESVSVPINAVVSLDKVGKPLDRAARVLAQCDVGPGS